jgi:hypothetical protein
MTANRRDAALGVAAAALAPSAAPGKRCSHMTLNEQPAESVGAVGRFLV